MERHRTGNKVQAPARGSVGFEAIMGIPHPGSEGCPRCDGPPGRPDWSPDRGQRRAGTGFALPR